MDARCSGTLTHHLTAPSPRVLGSVERRYIPGQVGRAKKRDEKERGGVAHIYEYITQSVCTQRPISTVALNSVLSPSVVL